MVTDCISKDDSKQKIIFLLGAGCETGELFGISSGLDFKEQTIRADDVKQFYKKINNSKKFQIRKGPIIHSNTTSVLYQTIIEHKEKFDNLEEDRYKRYIDDYIAYKEEKIKEEEKRKKIIDHFEDYYKKCFYDLLKQNIEESTKLDQKLNHENENRKELYDIFLKNAGIYSYVDSLFNFLRFPYDYPNESARVMKLYYSAYLAIIKNIVPKDEFERFIQGDKIEDIDKNRIEWENIVQCNINNKLDEIDKSKEKHNLYYEIIRKSKEYIEPFVMTTNYTPFVEKIIELDANHLSYVHGKLNLFEEIDQKEVKQLLDFNKEDIIFPFIFIQSGIKPIVSYEQLSEYSKCINWIDDSQLKYIVILGYGINSDDEHIMNLLKSAAKKGKVIIDFIYKLEEKKNDCEKIKERLGNENVHFLDSEDFKCLIPLINNGFDISKL